MLKVKNLGSRFCSVSAGVIDKGEVKHIAKWELKMLTRIGTYNLQLIMDVQ